VRRLAWTQHVPFEDLGNLATWAKDRDFRIDGARLFAGDPLPRPSEFDWLVVTGGPMSVHDAAEHPWLPRERELIGEALARGQSVLGICLGSRQLAVALGAPVYAHRLKEVGWFPIEGVPGHGPLAGLFGKRTDVVHWHGDTFDLPAGAVHLARSAGCENQAFAWGERALGLQFHLEMARENVARMCDACAGDLAVPGPYVSTRAALLAADGRFARAEAELVRVLDRLDAASTS
jgi:GMP synthase-like glutamine amidotransferase